MGGIYGFDLDAILSLADRFKIVVDDQCLAKFQHIEGLILERQAETVRKASREAEAKRRTYKR
jgi:hypothetical protein